MSRIHAHLALVTLLAILAAAPGRASAADPPCKPKVTFEWIGSSTVKLWTDAEFATTVARRETPPFWNDPAERSRVINTSYTPGKNEGEKASQSKDEKAPSDAPPIIVRVGNSKSFIPVEAAAADVHIASDNATGHTFLLDVSEEPIVTHNGRASVILRNVKCADGNPRTVQIADAVVMEQHHLAVDVGASFALDRGGSLHGHPEYSLNAYSRWLGPLSGAVDLRITTLEKVASGSGPDQGGSFLAAGGNTIDTSARLLLNLETRSSFPFFRLAREGTLPWLAVVGGGGVRTVPVSGSTDASVDTRAKAFGGVRLQVLGYNADQPADGYGNARAHLEVGAADDGFWRDTTVWRLYAQAQLEVPKVGTQYFRFLVRGAVDRPLQFGSSGPAELRISVLSSLDPTALGNLLGLSVKSAAK